VSGITDLITTPGLINLDFADVKSVMSGAGSALMGIGSARGDNRAVEAAEMAISSPLLEASIDGAHGVLLSISGGSDLGLFEINEAAQLVVQAAHQEANIIFGAVIDDALGDEVRVTVIAAGFDGGTPRRASSASTRKAEATAAAAASTASRPTYTPSPLDTVPRHAAPMPPATPASTPVPDRPPLEPAVASGQQPGQQAGQPGSNGHIALPRTEQPVGSRVSRPARTIVFDDDDLDVPDFLK
jgi:cell division protein FtsZ